MRQRKLNIFKEKPKMSWGSLSKKKFLIKKVKSGQNSPLKKLCYLFFTKLKEIKRTISPKARKSWASASQPKAGQESMGWLRRIRKDDFT